jgi:hypothetical protein
MSIKSKIIIALGGFVIALSVTAALRANEGPSKEAEPAHSNASQTLPEELAADQVQDEAFDKLSPAEQQQFLAPIRAKAQQESNAMIQAALRAEVSAPSPDPCPYRGVLNLAVEPALPMPFHAWQFVVANYWGGVVDGVCLGVYAGYDPANPMLGELVIWKLNESGPWQFYPTPTASGPITIVSETNGTIKVSSLKGTYYTGPEAASQVPVETPGGGIYVFDLKARRYR